MKYMNIKYPERDFINQNMNQLASYLVGTFIKNHTEDFLNILDANKKPAKVLARLLIGSCLDNVELSDSSEFGAYKSFWVDGGVLAMQFLSYGDRCEERLMAKLDVASKRLRFFPSR